MQLAQKIVVRLRLVFLAVSLVLVSAMVVGYMQMSNLGRTAKGLTENSVPVFVRAQEVERSLTELVLSLRALEKIGDTAALSPLKQELERNLDFLRANAALLTGPQASGTQAEKTERAFSSMDALAPQLFDLRRDILVYDVAMRQSEDFLKESYASMRAALEVLAYDISLMLGRELAGDAMTRADLDQAYSQRLRHAIAVTELTLGIESLVTTAARVRQAMQADEVTEVEKALQFRLQTLPILASQLWPGEARTRLAEDLLEFRRLVFGAGGLLDLAARQRALLSRFEDLSGQERREIQTISAAARDLVATTRSQVDEARRGLDASAGQVIWIMLVAGLSSLLVFGFANVLIVEKQINRRMHRLTRAVSAIAADETDHEVDVAGEDELAEMAQALETFKATAKELRRSNSELEKFAYVAAHDLRSPLRAIQDIAEWTMEDEENNLSEQGRENMELLQKRVQRLNLLLSDLLAYSRVGLESGDLASLSLPRMVTELKEMLDPTGQFEITYSGVVNEIVTFATPLHQIMLNLLANSIKHHDRQSGAIHVAARIDGGRLHVSVRDDGPGIEPQYHDRVFGLFQTLRPRDEVEGSGLGLAIIRKLLEHHGGTIRVTSDPGAGRGTRFDFDLPERSADLPDTALTA